MFHRAQHTTPACLNKMFHNRLNFSHKELRIVENSTSFILSYFLKKNPEEQIIPLLFSLQSMDSSGNFYLFTVLLKNIQVAVAVLLRKHDKI